MGGRKVVCTKQASLGQEGHESANRRGLIPQDTSLERKPAEGVRILPLDCPQRPRPPPPEPDFELPLLEDAILRSSNTYVSAAGRGARPSGDGRSLTCILWSLLRGPLDSAGPGGGVTCLCTSWGRALYGPDRGQKCALWSVQR